MAPSSRLTGLSGSGKTTLATAVAARVRPLRPSKFGRATRSANSCLPSLGFTLREDRELNVWRTDLSRDCWPATVLPNRPRFRPTPPREAKFVPRPPGEASGFVEVFLDAELQCLVDRDVKGLYKRALAGELPNFARNILLASYEAPTHPEIVVRTDENLPP